MPPRAVLSWSGGKDSSLALYEVARSKDLQIGSLLTTLTRDFDRISMHGVRRALLKSQADMLHLPITEVWITQGASNAEYEARMSEALAALRSEGVRQVVFGTSSSRTSGDTARGSFRSSVWWGCSPSV